MTKETGFGGIAVPALLLAVALAGCNGSYSGSSGSGGDDNTETPDGGSDSFASTEAFFDARVAPHMDFCRSCHVPGGIADTEDGRRFMLSQNSGQDYGNFKASWDTLGGGVEGNRILVMNSGGEPHSGGRNWPQDSAAYNDVVTLFSCWDDPDNCDLRGDGDVDEQRPLLGSSRAQHVWKTYCEDKPDDAELPADPRTLVRPGANEDRAVFFNAYWQDCHAELLEHKQHAQTCGEYRARRDKGLHFLQDVLPASAMSAQEFNSTWEKWGYDQRPENFDELYRLRYGLNRAPFDNPYPRPGEDPAATDGGSGQLPQGLRQIKNDNGEWTGQIGTAACFQCHGGYIDGPGSEEVVGLENLGIGNSNYDVRMDAQDRSLWAGTPLSGRLPNVLDVNRLFNIGIKQRGQNNAVGAFEVLITLLDLDSLGLNPNPAKTLVGDSGLFDVAHPLAHTQDTPQWWNLSHRPRKFFDAGVSSDSTRIIMAAGPGEYSLLLTPDGKAYRDHIAEYDQAVEAFLLSLESPPYPDEVDEGLARQGAVIFHSLDLWSRPGNEDRPEPLGGNGSCAGCHGAYSPRYVHDESYLEDPALEGVAGHISPLPVIGTDRARSDMLTPTLRERWDSTYWAFPEGSENYIPPEQKSPALEAADDMYPLSQRPSGACGWQKDVIGYQAPPLYGVWATAPYFHNGSVPTIEQVLDPTQRPAIWQRKLREDGHVKGFDLRMETAYDYQRLGWKHDVLTCGDMPGNTFFNCSPAGDQGPSLVQVVENALKGLVGWAGVVPVTDLDPEGFDKRLIYDSRTLGNGKQGHEFTRVLTEQERRAVIEYLKTL